MRISGRLALCGVLALPFAAAAHAEGAQAPIPQIDAAAAGAVTARLNGTAWKGTVDGPEGSVSFDFKFQAGNRFEMTAHKPPLDETATASGLWGVAELGADGRFRLVLCPLQQDGRDGVRIDGWPFAVWAEIGTDGTLSGEGTAWGVRRTFRIMPR